MRAPVTVAAVVVALAGAAPAWADPGAGTATAPRFVDHTEWVRWGALASLRVYPTPAARAAAGRLGPQADKAWSEVLSQAPDADTAGMRAQFVCHWQLAELAQPGKASWNLEPWRPVVDDTTMLASGCNPGGPEEPV
ncbi:DUF2599 domain-containing protein [Mycobacterium xenopi]|uniref:DUF2599 domain-containing protein n=1 Tax=Mycobacterium xenopi TaxID=1789 RepID=UPI00025ACD61|nr:DUF2599 domain-containing protein [Mycobacterium xenopi]EID16429.1 putative secreted protein [Mycobacterium xenopi RIVM700367]MDA3658723.1 DUF2599 domain-containing protein [Mycobacterium xenopi]MDA3660795.1 DUF2599 domain-containing protein [Mycobacterium xenopi]ORX16159.1 hypothetical protein AWC32_13085 [Mycobacterium xenopi]